jgi:hypothetical protein
MKEIQIKDSQLVFAYVRRVGERLQGATDTQLGSTCSLFTYEEFAISCISHQEKKKVAILRGADKCCIFSYACIDITGLECSPFE